MSFAARGIDLTFISAADLSARQFRAVKLDANGQLVQATAGDFAIGVLQNKPNIGQPGTVRVHGVTKMVADAAVGAGVTVSSSADGEAATATRATDNILGVSLVAASGAGVVIPVLVTISGVGVAD